MLHAILRQSLPFNDFPDIAFVPNPICNQLLLEIKYFLFIYLFFLLLALHFSSSKHFCGVSDKQNQLYINTWTKAGMKEHELGPWFFYCFFIICYFFNCTVFFCLNHKGALQGVLRCTHSRHGCLKECLSTIVLPPDWHELTWVFNTHQQNWWPCVG